MRHLYVMIDSGIVECGEGGRSLCLTYLWDLVALLERLLHVFETRRWNRVPE